MKYSFTPYETHHTKEGGQCVNEIKWKPINDNDNQKLQSCKAKKHKAVNDEWEEKTNWMRNMIKTH